MQFRVLGLAVVAALSFSGAASAQSLTIERHDNLRGDRVMRSERIERMEVRTPRVTSSTKLRGKSAMAPGQIKRSGETGREAMERTLRKPVRNSSVTIHRR